VRGDSAHDLQEPRRACVDDARLTEDVELLLGARERPLAVGDQLAQGLGERRRRLRERFGALGELAREGEDRALLRVPDGGVAGVARGPQGSGEGRRIDRRSVRKLLGGAAHELGEDDSRVPAGAHQNGLREVGAGISLERFHDRAHGQGHVRAGVPVGHRVDVEVVDPPAARLERGQCGSADL
jgi:hypothetical protein